MSKQVEGRGALSPIVVFTGLVALVAAITAGVLLTREETPPTPDPVPGASATPAPDETLTDEEAIARFKELDALRIEAYEEADASRVDAVFTPSSPTGRRVVREIRLLARDGVHSETSFDTRRLAIVVNGPDEIVLRQVVIVDPDFRTASGRNVTGHARTERQVIHWVLRPVGNQLLIHDSEVVRARPVEQ